MTQNMIRNQNYRKNLGKTALNSHIMLDCITKDNRNEDSKQNLTICFKNEVLNYVHQSGIQSSSSNYTIYSKPFITHSISM
jgi:hypothetical protein